VPFYQFTDSELLRIDTAARVCAGGLSICDAAAIIARTERTVFRDVKTYREYGPAGFASRKRGMASNNRYSEAFRQKVCDILTADYADYAPELAADRLAANHGIHVSRETIRTWMMQIGLWTGRKDHKRRVHSPRARKANFGQLIQIDTSNHDWFEDRGPRSHLVTFIDDATSRIVKQWMAEGENTFAYMRATRAYFEKYGKPMGFYCDRHSVLYEKRISGDGGPRLTQFGRALVELGVPLDYAYTKQARGRVERSHATHQDRLVKYFREEGINSIEAANLRLAEYAKDHNSRFAKEPREPEDRHRPLSDIDDLDTAFSIRTTGRLSPSLSLQFQKRTIVLDENPASRAMIGRDVTIERHLDGRVTIRHGRQYFSFSDLDW
jgi:transposase